MNHIENHHGSSATQPASPSNPPINPGIHHTQPMEDPATDLEPAPLDLFDQLRSQRNERLEAVAIAQPALARLCQAMAQKTGQSHIIRLLLYSLWNGKPASLLEIVSLDWPIRKDVVAIILAFGFENSTIGPAPEYKLQQGVCFFYDAIKTAVTQAGLWEWFLQAAHPDPDTQA